MKKVLALILVVLIGIMSGGGCGSSKTTDIPATVIAGAGVGGDVPTAASVPVSGTLASLLIIKNAITGAELFRTTSLFGTTSTPWIAYIDPALTIKIEVYNDNDLTTPRSSIKVEMPAVTTSTTNPTNTIICDFDEEGKDSIAVVAIDNTAGDSDPVVTNTNIQNATFVKLPAGDSNVTLNSPTEVPTGTTTTEVMFTATIPTKSEVTTIKATTEPIGFSVNMPNTTTGDVTFQFNSPVTIPTDSAKGFQFYAKMTKVGSAVGYAMIYKDNEGLKIKKSATLAGLSNATAELLPTTSYTLSSEKLSSIVLKLASGQPSSIYEVGQGYTAPAGGKIIPGVYQVTLELKNLSTGLLSSYGPQQVTVN